MGRTSLLSPRERANGDGINAYVLGGRTCCADLARWCRSENYFPQVAYVFEDGDVGQGDLSNLLQRHGYPRPSFGYKCDRETPMGIVPGTVQLQAADWLAYEMFQSAKRLFMNDPAERHKPLRWACNQFDRIPGVAGFYDPKDLMVLQDNLENYERRELRPGDGDGRASESEA